MSADDYRLRDLDVPSAAVSEQIMYAAAMGMAGVRAYAYDAWWSDERRNARPGNVCQVGSSPLGAGSNRWQAMASAFNLIKHLEPYLLQPQMNAVDLGPYIVTGARQGKDSRLLLAVNCSQTAEPVRVDLTPYRYLDGTEIVRFRLLGATLRTDTLTNATFNTVTFAPGETIVWLCRQAKSRGENTTPIVRLLSPLPDETLSGTITVRALSTNREKIDRVELAVDGAAVATVKKAPFTFTWDSTTVKPDCWHGLCVTAYDAVGYASEDRIAVRTVANH